MSGLSTPNLKITWRERREAVSLMQVLATQQARIPERLGHVRRTLALTQEQAAARAGVTLRAWQRWERGESEPYARNLAKISEEFGIPMNELVGSDPEPEPSQLDRIEESLALLHAKLDSLSDADRHLTQQDRELLRRWEELAQRIGANVGRGRPLARSALANEAGAIPRASAAR